jgi:hypothetical protein
VVVRVETDYLHLYKLGFIAKVAVNDPIVSDISVRMTVMVILSFTTWPVYRAG